MNYILAQCTIMFGDKVKGQSPVLNFTVITCCGKFFWTFVYNHCKYTANE